LTDKTKPVTLVVRRGALRRFDRLKQATRELPADVVWDRRQQPPSVETSGSSDRAPEKDRRKGAPSTWELADFAVVESSSTPRPKSTRSKKA
jgi:hypothetical protein